MFIYPGNNDDAVAMGNTDAEVVTDVNVDNGDFLIVEVGDDVDGSGGISLTILLIMKNG